MKVYGLTGNIGTGKSTVARMLRERGVPVVDADAVAREVVEPGTPALAEIARRFPEVIRPDGTLDRKLLATKVFGDADARAVLNAIVHPRIAERSAALLDGIRRSGAPFAIYEAALIVENGLHQGLDGLIVVTAPPEVQLRRLALRGQDDAAARVASQLSQAEKLRHATFVLDNSGDERALRRQVDAILEKLPTGVL